MKRYFNSSWILIALCAFIVLFRMSHIDEKEFSWDVFGYYLPLPATFVHNDPMLNDISWVENVNNEKHLTDTLYQISRTPEGEPMYFFFLGMSMVYLIFFLIGHGVAAVAGYPMDGFSEPYIYSVLGGMILITIVGLIFLRKILLRHFSDLTTSILLILLVIGTNYSHHMTLKNLETVNVLFTMVCIAVWCTIRWHEDHKLKYLIGIILPIGLMALIKPSEILFAIFPLVYGVHDKQSFHDKVGLIKRHYKQFLMALSVVILIGLPQIIYWKLKTGFFLYDSYINPGVGLDIFSPHIWDSLFSYRKGWLIYTPVMLFALVGFSAVYKKDRKWFWPVLVTFSVCFYVVCSWSEWWYGAGFSNRPLITYYPLLLIPMGYFLESIVGKSRVLRYLVAAPLLLFLFLNQFQWWQLRNYILDPYRTTKEYYWATFLKTSVSEDDLDLLLVQRSFNGVDVFNDQENYQVQTFFEDNFSKEDSACLISKGQDEFPYSNRFEYSELTDRDHIWVELKFRYRNLGEDPVILGMMMNRKEGAYGYRDARLGFSSEWNDTTLYFLTPSIRDVSDEFKFDFWKSSEADFYLDDFKFLIYEKKIKD